jgi:hypothetical protein
LFALKLLSSSGSPSLHDTSWNLSRSDQHLGVTECEDNKYNKLLDLQLENQHLYENFAILRISSVDSPTLAMVYCLSAVFEQR